MSLDNRSGRTIAGAIGLYGGLLSSIAVAATLWIVFAPAKNSTLDIFVAHHTILFRQVLWVVFFGSVITFLCSLFGQGRQRGLGAAISIVNFLMSISILGAGE